MSTVPMRLACAIPSILLAILLASIAVGSSPSPRPQGESAGEPSAPARDRLERERTLLEEASSALQETDYATARTKAAETVAALLARPVAEQDDGWLVLLSRAGDVAWNAQDARTARAAFERVLEIRSATLPGDHPRVQSARGNLALAIRELGDLAGARALQEGVVEILSRTLPSDDLDLQRARQHLANTLRIQGDLPAARELLEQVLEVRSRALPPEHAELQKTRLTLAATIFLQGDLLEARAMYEQVLEVYSRTLPADHPDLQATRLNLASVLRIQGDLPAARVLQEQALEVRSRTLPPDHPLLQLARTNLAATLSDQGDLSAARVLLEQALEVQSATLPSDHPNLQATRQNLANTLRAQGDVSAARALQEQVLEVYSRTLPPGHPDLQSARTNLANALTDLGDHAAARALEEQVLEVYALTLPAEHPELLNAQLHLATALRAEGDFAGARILQEHVLEVGSRVLPPDHFLLQTTRSNLANTLRAQGELPEARALDEQVLEARSRALPPGHRDLQSARQSLAITLARQAADAGEGAGASEREACRERCMELVSDLSESAAEIARIAMLSSSSREAEERCASLKDALSVSLSFAAGYGVFPPDPDLEHEAFLLSETTRGTALVSATLARLARDDERCAGLRSEVQSAGEELARLVQAGATPDAFDATIRKRDVAQRELVQRAGTSKDAAGLLAEPDPAALSRRLSEGDAIVAYRRYGRRAILSGGSEYLSIESLCAFVLRPRADLQRIELGAIEPIEAAIEEWRDALGSAEGRGAAVSAYSERSRDELRLAERIRELVVDPLRSSLGDARHLVVVLDDVLHAVPLEALPTADDASASSAPVPEAPGRELLGDRYRIELRSTVQELLSTAEPPTDAGLVVVVGGTDYSKEPSTGPPSVSQAGILRGSAWEGGFAFLPGTLEEARGVTELAARTSDTSEVVLLEAAEASRDSIERLAPRARVLHLATHGWFAPESVRSWNDPEPLDGSQGAGRGREDDAAPGWRTSAQDRVKGSSPMLLCGLALAGANRPADALGRHPGLVTAEEISSWDLSGCELAVLSACDTNVGERRAGQGVASLQKALHMAGARSVITSLWKVPDEATRELMTDFYRRIWLEGKPKRQALWEAKTMLREAEDDSGRPRYSTRDWAAWVLTGAPD